MIESKRLTNKDLDVIVREHYERQGYVVAACHLPGIGNEDTIRVTVDLESDPITAPIDPDNRPVYGKTHSGGHISVGLGWHVVPEGEVIPQIHMIYFEERRGESIIGWWNSPHKMPDTAIEAKAEVSYSIRAYAALD